MSLFERLKRSCESDWQNYVHHEFGSKLVNETLEYSGFLNYLQQDYIYLIHYMRCFAMLAYKGRSQGEINFGIDKLVKIRDVEMEMHRSFQELNINVESIEEHVSCTAYTRYLLDVAVTGDYLELLVAIAPCYIGYGEMGKNIRDLPSTENNKYAEWILMYGDDEYLKACDEFVDYLNKYESEVTEVRFERLEKIFRDVTRLEIKFFDIAMEVK